MDMRIILLLQLFALMTTATRVSLEDAEDNGGIADPAVGSEEDENEEENEEELNLPQLDSSDCQFQVIKNCNRKFKSSFTNKAESPERENEELYCEGMQSFMRCLEATTCRGVFLDNYSYVVLQHGMMDKKLNMCPNHNFRKLKKKVEAVISEHRFIDDISADRPTDCSIKIHRKCVKQFTKNMKSDSNMCQDVQSFISCYKKESPKCKAEITQHFTHLCTKLGERMLKANERHRSMMC